MKITATGPGIMADFIRATGATVRGRFVHLPASVGAGYITGFAWGDDLRVMIRHYYLHEDIHIEWVNEALASQEHVAFLLSGVLPAPGAAGPPLAPEQARVLVCRQLVSSAFTMPAATQFGSVTIGVSQRYLRQLFGHLAHPVVASVLAADSSFVLEAGVSAALIGTAGEMLRQPVPASLESQYYRLKCEELLCHVLALLMQREAVPLHPLHPADVKAVYAVAARLQQATGDAPGIAALAREAGLSQPKLRRLFRQTFGQGLFEYYQARRMQEAARLLREQRLTVAEVGHQLGFSNLSHFARAFRQHTGLTPKKYAAQ